MSNQKADSNADQRDNTPGAVVSIVRANDYDLAEIYGAVGRGIELIGGLDAIIQPGDRVFVKINHLPPASPPERGITTHPVFAEAVVKLLKEAGADITVGDDIESGPTDGFSVSGFRQMCQRADVPLVNLREAGFYATECNGCLLKTVYLSRIAADADVIINLPKLKTHSLTVFTGAIKNMYGTIPVSLRRKYHGEFTKSEDFSLMLTEVFSAIRPQLTIMDGIIAMEGEGPASGSLRKLGVILASYDGVALDTVAGSIVGLSPRDIATTRFADERGLGVGRLENIEVAGESISSVAVTDFKRPEAATRTILRWIPRPVSRFMMNQTSIRPLVLENQCSACGECVKICPVGAVSIAGEVASINHSICIECLCCHEVCRYDAIALRRSASGRTINRIKNAVKKVL